MSHGALQHVPFTAVPWSPPHMAGIAYDFPLGLWLSILPHCTMWDSMGWDGTIPSIPSPAHCCPVVPSPSSPRNIPWNPHNMSQGACTCPMEPYNMSHGSLITCPVEPLQHVPCPMEPSQHVPWGPPNMSHGSLVTCPMEPS